MPTKMTPALWAARKAPRASEARDFCRALVDKRVTFRYRGRDKNGIVRGVTFINNSWEMSVDLANTVDYNMTAIIEPRQLTGFGPATPALRERIRKMQRES